MGERQLAAVARQHRQPDAALGDDMELGARMAARENNLARLEGRFPQFDGDGLAARLVEAAKKRRSSKEVGRVWLSEPLPPSIFAKECGYSCPVFRSGRNARGLAKGRNACAIVRAKRPRRHHFNLSLATIMISTSEKQLPSRLRPLRCPRAARRCAVRWRARRASSKAEIERPQLVLASASPRRVTLLAQVGVTPDACGRPRSTKAPKRGEMPRALVSRLARAKAEVARDQIANDRELAGAYMLAADTVVAMGRKILMKPTHIEEAMASLQLLSGRTHKVQTCVCLITPDDRVRTKIVDTRVRFRYINRSELESYIASREWRGKAGGYAIQGLAGCFVQRLIGSYTNVVGLPLTEVVACSIRRSFRSSTIG